MHFSINYKYNKVPLEFVDFLLAWFTVFFSFFFLLENAEELEELRDEPLDDDSLEEEDE